MLEWLQFIGEFLLNIITGIVDLFAMFVSAIGTFSAAFAYAPSFLQPILFLTLAVAVIMWVVNIF